MGNMAHIFFNIEVPTSNRSQASIPTPSKKLIIINKTKQNKDPLIM